MGDAPASAQKPNGEAGSLAAGDAPAGRALGLPWVLSESSRNTASCNLPYSVIHLYLEEQTHESFTLRLLPRQPL